MSLCSSDKYFYEVEARTGSHLYPDPTPTTSCSRCFIRKRFQSLISCLHVFNYQINKYIICPCPKHNGSVNVGRFPIWLFLKLMQDVHHVSMSSWRSMTGSKPVLLPLLLHGKICHLCQSVWTEYLSNAYCSSLRSVVRFCIITSKSFVDNTRRNKCRGLRERGGETEGKFCEEFWADL